jgi:drug/metabolite transporter (DMT)-like permease
VPPPPPRSIGRAATWVGGWLALMTLMAVAGREAGRELDVFQVMMLRSLMGLVLIAPLIRSAGGLHVVRTKRWRGHLGRNIAHYAAQYGWLLAVTMIPLTQVISIEFTMPLWVALLAAAFLGERLTPTRIAAAVLGLAGVAVIVRPAADAVDPGQLIALAAAVGFAVAVTMVKSLTRTETPASILFWMTVIQLGLGLVPGIAVWRDPTAAGWGWVVVVAICGTYSHFCLANALRHADATTVVPMDFLRVPLTALAGWLVYGERIDLFTVAGAALILAANVLNLRRR